jgi:DNA-binding CsgD family transcriptional regulator
MRGRGTAAGFVDGVERTCTTAKSADDLFEVLSHELANAVPFDASVWFGVDPATLLAVAPARLEHQDSAYCNVFWHNEFHSQDVALFRDLARQPVPAASLRQTTGDRPVRSARYRDMMRPLGWGDDLRVVFRTGGRTWGMAALLRDEGRPAFDADDVALMSAISPVVGAAIRMRAAVEVSSPVLSAAPGVMVFDGDGVLVSANDEGTRWLAESDGPSGNRLQRWVGGSAPAGSIVPVLQRARAVAAGHEEGPARLRFRDRSGRWLVLHASSLLGGPGDGMVAVVVEPAKSAEIAPIVIEAYGLAPRERDVVQALARGLSTPEIAASLFLSAHTVRDYIKAVFEKTGVSSRAELVAKLFAEHYLEPVHQAAVVVD